MASKQQDVAVLDNWEEMDEIDVLDQKFATIIGSSTISTGVEEDMCDAKMRRPKSKGTPPTSSAGATTFSIVFTGDDALRSQYVPPEPTVKILKRPTIVKENNDCKSVQPKKTLQQREEEYAQARLRILGDTTSSNKQPEDNKVCSIQNKEPSSHNHPQPVTAPPIIPPRDMSDNVIRQPMGPDGTNGFKIRR